MKLSISSEILAALQRIARDNAPEEICGLLFGGNETVQAFEQTANISDNPKRCFEIDPEKLIAAEKAMRAGGPSILGYYHSHPGGAVEPSQTDANSAAADGRIWLIINGQDAAAWKAMKNSEVYDRFTAIALDCIDTKGQTAKNLT